MNDPITNQPVGEWITQDATKPEFDALRYRGKLVVLLDQTSPKFGSTFRDFRAVKCIRCVGAFYRLHKEVVIHRWMILPP